MKKLYEKTELGFALMWIGIYCLGMSVFDAVSVALGAENAATAVFALIVSLFLQFWLRRQGLAERFGLCRVKAPARVFWFYIPLALITLYNLWLGVGLRYGALETVSFVVKMLCVGFLEELIFRGFLFKAMSRDSVKWAVIVSSLSFGLGHILNLINGSGMGLAENLVQIVSAVLIGFLYVLIFIRSGSLWMCIISHGVFNSLSAFSVSEKSDYTVIILCVITIIYALIILKTFPQKAVSEK